MLESEPEMAIDLPEDILINIFSRMPAKSVGKCWCLSRSWRTLLSTPYFIKYHLAQNKIRPHDNLILKRGGLLYSIATVAIVATVEDVIASGRIRLPGFWEDVVCSCDGLVLLVKSSKRKTENFLVNPVTLSMARIPTCPLEIENDGASTLGFGYDSLADDYKIGYLPCDYKANVSKRGCTETFMGVYSVKLGAWKTVKSHPYRYSAYSHGAFVNGAIHWLAAKSKVGKLGNWCVSALNLACETFFEIPIPIPSRQEKYLKIVCLRGCLCVFNLLAGGSTDIWIMEKYDVAGDWIKSYHVYSEVWLIPLCFIEREEVVAIDIEGILIVLNLRDQTLRDLYVFVDVFEEFRTGCSFLESLVEPTFSGV
ncbi:hypothetical protein CASFOL_028990 [Castilleja foliolosa]|uniref:F-box domain-containing protein n=1 Tax=Castilleja foliolosa TaxID=1961234 RepID=A0ABD3CDM2_9LAMI